MKNLVAADGMKLALDWLDLDGIAKTAWLAQLDSVSVRAQAAVLSAANGRSVRQVLNAWVALGYLPAARLPLVLAAQAQTGAAQRPDEAA
jgi:hypothetical protein